MQIFSNCLHPPSTPHPRIGVGEGWTTGGRLFYDKMKLLYTYTRRNGILLLSPKGETNAT